MSLKVPFCKHIKTKDFRSIDFDDLDLTGSGIYGKKVQQKLCEYHTGSSVFLTPSGSAALEMGAILLDLKPGDEVIMPSFTFTSTANAVLLRGAIPVFVDIKPGSLDIDEKLVKKAINEKTKCIMPVFYGGASSNIDELEKIADANDLFLFPDAAQAIGSYYKGKALGDYGCLSALSFHQTKNIGCGEGGALLVNDESLVKRAEIIQEKGTNRAEFFRGEVNKYSWKGIGSSYLMSDLCSAYLHGPICNLEEITKRRRAKWDYYHEQLAGLKAGGEVALPEYSKDCEHNGHIYFVQFKTAELAEEIRVKLNEAGVNAVSHYYPLHMTETGEGQCKLGSKMTVTEGVFDRILRLPLYDHMSQGEQNYVIKLLKKML